MKTIKKLYAMSLAILIMLSSIFFANPVLVYGSNRSYTSSDDENTSHFPPSGGTSTEHLENRIRELEMQLMFLTAMFNVTPEVDHASITRQRQEAVLLERYVLHLTYYSVCLAIAQNNLLVQQQELLERQLKLENVRYELGFSTQNNVTDLEAILNNVTRQIQINNTTILVQRRQFDSRRGQQGYGFIRNFEIPNPSTPNARSEDTLRTNLIRYNTSLFVLGSHIDQARRHRVTGNEISLLEEQQDLLRRQLEIAATNTWDAYLNARAQHNLALSEQDLLHSRLNLIEEMFYLGEISEVDRLAQRFNIYVELHRVELTSVTLAIAIAEVNFMMLGIVGS